MGQLYLKEQIGFKLTERRLPVFACGAPGFCSAIWIYRAPSLRSQKMFWLGYVQWGGQRSCWKCRTKTGLLSENCSWSTSGSWNAVETFRWESRDEKRHGLGKRRPEMEWRMSPGHKPLHSTSKVFPSPPTLSLEEFLTLDYVDSTGCHTGILLAQYLSGGLLPILNSDRRAEQGVCVHTAS